MISLLLVCVGPLLDTAQIWMFKLLIDDVLVPRHFGPFLWIGSSDQALLAVILSAVLTIPGGGVVLYSAAMGSLPRELYEAADLEGASPFAKWRHKRWTTSPSVSMSAGAPCGPSAGTRCCAI